MVHAVSKNGSSCVTVVLPIMTEIFSLCAFIKYFQCKFVQSVITTVVRLTNCVRVFLAMSLNRIIRRHCCVLKRNTIGQGVT